MVGGLLFESLGARYNLEGLAQTGLLPNFSRQGKLCPQRCECTISVNWRDGVIFSQIAGGAPDLVEDWAAIVGGFEGKCFGIGDRPSGCACAARMGGGRGIPWGRVDMQGRGKLGAALTSATDYVVCDRGGGQYSGRADGSGQNRANVGPSGGGGDWTFGDSVA